MGNGMTAKDILESYDDVTIIQEEIAVWILFSFDGKEFLLTCPDENDPTSRADVYIYNDDGVDYPHIMFRNLELGSESGFPSGRYRFVCLYEQESVVYSLLSYEDKIMDSIDRLIELVTMNESQKTKEFQKEFLFYWNEFSSSYAHVYLQQDTQFACMNKFCAGKSVRYVEEGMRLSDLDLRDKEGNRRWQNHIETDTFFIPITDNREILPPYRNHPWTVESVREIIYGLQISHISSETFFKLKEQRVSTQDVILVFGMNTVYSKICFALKIKCANKTSRTLFEKLYEDAKDVSLISIERKDYLYLNEQIGNTSDMYEKKILIVGAGSLGSYVATEFVKNGANNLIIYDGDRLFDENRMRWTFGWFGIGTNKALTLKTWLEFIHPQVHIDSQDKNLDEKMLENELQSVDLIVFTVGSSDTQLKLNRILKKLRCNIPVIFSWLESGGEHSHILYVDYSKAGCFECLYTDGEGRYVNNRATLNTDEESENSVIRNACGGTRAAYGTTVLLRTTAVLMETVQKVSGGDLQKSTLIDITPEKVLYLDDIIPAKGCKCCGHKEE